MPFWTKANLWVKRQFTIPPNGDSTNMIINSHDENDNIGIGNTFIGRNAGAKNTCGFWNTFLGAGSGQFNDTGSLNTFLGHESGVNNTSGKWNTFIGANTAYTNSIGAGNTFLGQGAGFFNTTGSRNTFVGTQSGDYNTIGNDNTMLGYFAGYNCKSDNNTFIGMKAGWQNETGKNNVLIGNHSGTQNISGNSNILIGHFSKMGYPNISSSISLGCSTLVTHDHQFVVGSPIKGYEITDVYFGQGVETEQPKGVCIHASGGENKNATGGDLTLAGGIGMGKGKGGSIKFSTSEEEQTEWLRHELKERACLNSKGNFGIGEKNPATRLDLNGAMTYSALSEDPEDPEEGHSVIWLSDGTGSGDNGDVMIKITACGTTKVITMIDFSER